MSWWEGAGATRLARDKAIVAEVQPALRHEVRVDGEMALVGDFLLTTRVGVDHRIPTRIDFPATYPEREPTAYEVGGLFKKDIDRHFYSDTGACCLWLDVESPWRRDDPQALRVFLDQLLIFYHRQVMIEARVVDAFPGPQRSHGGYGYLDYLKERWAMTDAEVRRMRFALANQANPKAPCGCGSGTSYRRCHQGEVTRFLQRARPDIVSQFVTVLDGMRASPNP